MLHLPTPTERARMYIDISVLDNECTRLACLLADRGMEHLTVPDPRTPQRAGADLEDEFSDELGKAYARIAEAGSDEDAILPSMIINMASKLAILATDLSIRSDRDASDIIRTIGGR